MLLGETRIGKPIDIYINRDGYHYRVVSKIEDASEGRVCISLIASTKHVFQFLSTDIIDIVYRNEDRMWKWTNVTGGIVELDGEKFHCLYSDQQGESYNRRNAYRISINESVDLLYKVTEQSDFSEMEECYRIENCPAIIRDISEVGVGFYTNQLLNLETEVSFTFQSSIGDINCSAVIIRFFESRHGKYSYYYGGRLTETSRTLTKYIYETQRQELQKLKARQVRS